MMDDQLPKPGSREAVASGCTCPVVDNHNGSGYGGDGKRFGWWYSSDCPVHSAQKPPTEYEHLAGCVADTPEEVLAKLTEVYPEALAVHTDRIKALEAERDRLEGALIHTASHLAAAISLLEHGGKKAAPSDKMFDQMLKDYHGSLEMARAALKSEGDG